MPTNVVNKCLCQWVLPDQGKLKVTRMHSSGMCTARRLCMCVCVWGGGACLLVVGGCMPPGWWGGGGVASRLGRPPPHMRGTDRKGEIEKKVIN